MNRITLGAASLLASVISSTATARAQRTWVVDDTMAAGADFPDLVSAYNAAAWNDRIHVRFGSGTGYQSPPAYDKPLRVIGLGTGVNVRKPIVYARDSTITCPAGEVFLMDNLELRRPASLTTYRVAVWNSMGVVILSRIYHPIQGSDAFYSWGSRRVVLVDCAMDSGFGAIDLQNSNGWVLNCQTSATTGRITYWNGTIEVRQGSFLRVVGGRHVGGDGLADCWPLSAGHVGNPAIWSGQGPTIVSGPATLIGGILQHPHPTCGGGSGSARVSAISAPCGIGTVIDPMVTQMAPRVGPNCPTDISHEMPAVIPGPAARGRRQTIDAWGPSNSIVAVFASFLPAFDPIVLPVGDVWLDPYLTLHVATGAVDAQRHATFTTTIPSWLAIGDVLVYQAVSLSPQNTFEISQPGIAVVH